MKRTHMTITIELSDMQEAEQVLRLLTLLNIKTISIKEAPLHRGPVIRQGDKTLDPRQLFGIWQDHPRTLDQVRTAAWKRGQQ
jgi:hypothetical protein